MNYLDPAAKTVSLRTMHFAPLKLCSILKSVSVNSIGSNQYLLWPGGGGVEGGIPRFVTKCDT